MPLSDERLGSRDFDTGPDGGTGKYRYYVLFLQGETGSQDAAEDYIITNGGAPTNVNAYLLSRISTTHEGGNLYFVDVEYKRGIPTQASQTAGQSPSGQQTPGKDPNSGLSRDMSFSTGGGTRRIYKSISTRYSRAAQGVAAPSFGGLIGVDVTANKVEGCEVIAPTCDFTITKRFPQLTVGWFRRMMLAIACTNDQPYLGMDIGEVLFKGCDGNFKEDDKQGYPWQVTARFGFSRNKTIAKNQSELTFAGIDGDITIPDVRGWNYTWVAYAKKTQTVNIGGVNQDYIVQLPKFVYVEQVYDEDDLTVLNME